MIPGWAKPPLAVLVIALIAALAVLFLREDEVSLTPGEPEVVSVEQLSDLAAEREGPVYWLGEREGVEYEVTETSGGRFYVRYLEGGAEAGDERAEFLTVATYPSRNGVAALRGVVRGGDGAKLARTDDGAVLLMDPSLPQSAHLAYREADLQIEVYAPQAGEALRLASRGAVESIPDGAGG
jgi:hypothetical protein